jgi:tetratricopeptide (TPR) repeat protein
LIELLAGDARAAEEEFRAGHDALEAMGEVGYLSTAAGLLARALYLQDNLEEAERYADLAADTAAGDQMYQPEWAPSKARILARKGQTDEALELGRETVRITTETDDVVLQGDALMALGEVMEMHGDRDEAREVFQRALALYEIKGVLPWVQRAVQALGG